MPRFHRARGGRFPAGREGEAPMPKMKTNKSVAKRFKVTKKGRLRRYKAGVGHLNSHKTRRRKAHLRHPVIHEGAQVRTLKRLMAQA